MMWFNILLSISIILNFYLIYKLSIEYKGIQKITVFLMEIRRGEFNRRIHMGFKNKLLKNLGSQLNLLIDSYQRIIENEHNLELSNKKLISNISHDIRTPLTSMLGFIEVLQNSEELSFTERKEYLNIIYTKSLSLYKLIQDFFELSKLESNDSDMKLVKINIIDKVQDIMASFYPDFITNNITPEITLPEDSVYVWAYDNGVERVLQNLLSNALKYGKDGGIIGVCIRTEQDKVWVDIWDRGKGIQESEIPLLFTRLYTTEASRNDNLRGNGLGLAIAKQIVEKQNGEISVLSIPFVKTTFSFCLIRA